MWNFLILIFVFFVPKLIDAAVGIQPYVPKPPEFAGQEGCYSPTLQKVLSYNEPYTPISSDSCTRYLCLEDNTTTIETCGAIGYDKEKCTLTRDYSQAYPCCCGTLECENYPPNNIGGRDCHV